MNKIFFGSVVAIAVVVGGFLLLTSDDNSESNNSAAIVSETTPQKEAEESGSDELVTENRYIDYSEQNLAISTGTKQIVFFHAPWCSTCNAYEKEIIAQGVPEGITILKADYDSETELKQKYEVRLQSTFVLLDTEGNVERTWPFGQGLSNDISNLYDQVI